MYVRDLSMHTVHSVGECERIIEQGWRNRAVGYTLMNKDSSRSHSIFTIHLEICSTGEHIHAHTTRQNISIICLMCDRAIVICTNLCLKEHVIVVIVD